ncbi:TIGR02117 family protein [Marinobacter sp. ATCH36]|uniref:TIGR02117 family protein n=1 Tax=Marinobacter sp. ATCH36 TaxID=2945106 RepID=UPI0020212DC5|nr:TIGR02117 family protein [Marinobacter sp. ATCH36]MCL7945444.1 TIGR02117 family protein [Marinobacter sp. ATCH36]
MKAAGLFLMLFAVYGCTGKPYAVEPAAEADSAPTQRVYVVGHGWHVGVVVAADELNPSIPGLKERFGEAGYYELGWGDEGFYQASEITAGVTLRAIVWSKGTVMHVVALPVSPDNYFAGSDVVDTCLTAEGADSLIKYLSNSFARDANNNLVELQRGIYGDSQFYKGEGRYHLLNTSNKWTAKALKSAGMEISPTFKLMADSVLAFVEENREACVR